MLALSFVNPALLGFLALGAVPILIYLFNRRRFKVVRWAAMEFVLKALTKNRRRLRFENLLLLAVRVAVILFLVAGLARPIGRTLGPLETLAEKRRNLAIVLDASYSMGYRQGAQTSFERAKRIARDLAERLLKRGDRFGLITVASDARPLYPDPVFVDDRQKARILSEIQELEPASSPTDMAKGLAALARYLPRFQGDGGGAPGAPGVGKQVFILTDLQKSAIASERGLRDPGLRKVAADLEREGAEIVIVDCGAEEPANLAVTSLDMPDEVAGVDTPVRFVATVKSYSPEPVADIALDYYVDDVLQGSKPLSLEPGATEEVELYGTFREKGPHRFHVVLRTDDLPADNARYLAVDVRDTVDVSLVDGDPGERGRDGETDFLAVALAPAEDTRLGRENLIRPKVLREGLPEGELEGAQAVVLANVASLPDEQVDRLEAWVRRGGGLLVFLGPQTDRSFWNERLWKDGRGLLPGPVGDAVEVPEDERWFTLASDRLDHPTLRLFASADARPLLSLPRFWGYRRLEVTEGEKADPAVSVLARFVPATDAGSASSTGAGADGSSGDPALVEKRFGRGRVLVFTSTADGAWNNFFVHYGYLMLWQRATAYLADAGAARRNLGVGEPYEQVIPQSEYAPAILVTTPAGDPIERPLEKIPEEPDHFRLTHGDTFRPGFYEVRFAAPSGAGEAPGAQRVEWFAVNVDPEEADLAKIDASELRSLLPELKAQVEPERGVERLIRSPEAGGSRDELWREMLWAVVLLLVVESGLACAFGRKTA